jgi:hypothetical protein
MAINDPGTQDESVTPQDPSTMKMDEGDFKALRDAADSVGVQDVQLGRALNLFVLHLGHLYGFDPAQEDEKARKAAQEEEDKETTEQEQSEEDAKTQEQSSFDATPPATYPDGSIPEQTPPTDVPPITTQEGV